MRRDGESSRTPSSHARPAGDARAETSETTPDRGAPDGLGIAVRPVRPAVADRGLAVAAGVVALVIGMAVLKPWDQPAGDSAPRGEAPLPTPNRVEPTTIVTPRPTDDSAEGLAGPICLGGGGWRIASLEMWREHDVRVWRAIEPIPDASGPLDPAIPAAPVVAIEIKALGWCAPAYGPERPAGPAEVAGWIVAGGVAGELELAQVLPARGTTPLAALYVPGAPCPASETCRPAETGSGGQAWAPGRVVFRYEDRADGSTAWFAVDVELYEPTRRDAPGDG